MSSVAVNPPKTPVTKGSNGIATATLPNVCKMPGPPAPFVPTPLPNIGKSGDSPQGYSTTVKIEGQPVGIQGASFGSMGDVASKGTGGGIVSNNVEGPTKFLAPGSLNVKIEGKNVQYLGDQMLNNCGPGGSPANSATLAGVVQSPLAYGGEAPCPLCGAPDGHPIPNTDSSAIEANSVVSSAPPVYDKKGTQKGYMVAALICRNSQGGTVTLWQSSPIGSAGGFVGNPRSIPNTAKSVSGRTIKLDDYTQPNSNKAGQCAGAKALIAANEMGLKPVSMTEIWCGPSSANFKEGEHAKSCETCKKLLPALLCDK